MGLLWTLLTHAHTLAGAVLMLIYPLYATMMAIKSPSQRDIEQWLTYWILCSFLTHLEKHLQLPLEWIPVWYDVNLILAAWLVLPQFRGAAFLYKRYVREHIPKRHAKTSSSRTSSSSSFSSISTSASSPSGKSKSKKKSWKEFCKELFNVHVHVHQLHLHLFGSSSTLSHPRK